MKNKIIKKIINFGKKHKKLFYPIVAFIAMILSVYYGFLAMMDQLTNHKLRTRMIASFLILTISFTQIQWSVFANSSNQFYTNTPGEILFFEELAEEILQQSVSGNDWMEQIKFPETLWAQVKVEEKNSTSVEDSIEGEDETDAEIMEVIEVPIEVLNAENTITINQLEETTVMEAEIEEPEHDMPSEVIPEEPQIETELEEDSEEQHVEETLDTPPVEQESLPNNNDEGEVLPNNTVVERQEISVSWEENEKIGRASCRERVASPV